MPIINFSGRLGKGKTLASVIWAYEGYEQEETIFSNIWLDFEHIPVKTPYDFLGLYEGRFLADELWSLVDNRQAMTKKNQLITILLLRSRKRKFSFAYTQQYLQIDPRIAYITDYWIKPTCYPIDPYNEIPPELLVLERWDAEFNKLPTLTIENPEDFLDAYNTSKDPYTLQGMLDDKALTEALRLAMKEDGVQEELEKVGEEAKKSEVLKKLGEKLT